jgi:uracil phosphoribosyltransferase
MLCSASPGMGKQFHQWIPHIRERISKLKESPKTKEIKDYYKKIYPKSSDSDLNLVTDVFVDNHRKKMYIAAKFPEMKFDEIELLSEIITDEDIKKYEEAFGN